MIVLCERTGMNEPQLCQAKGFICEICNKMPPIYPFQLEITVLCRRCNVGERGNVNRRLFSISSVLPRWRIVQNVEDKENED